ncbi:hypothetical protein P154DRAFT_296052 [Amniculicola lignicola CBS 123094]|uniref:Uncharacterized protein n=1 Tax=Amniculicola lignicola CBS 123094 TaxID=1392246 RepID=A0A6A5W5V2_9PLEO|nr:hypothetical protein P154DRAFT_296052 [Amniculicola lignicola CBS 123094]
MPPKRKRGSTRKNEPAPKPRSQPAGPNGPSASNRGRSARGATSSRLQPSTPLHMTTRRAASKAASNRSTSGASSVTSGSSRRSSLNDVAQNVPTISGDEDARPAKRSRASTEGGSPHNSAGSFSSKTAVTHTQTPEEHRATSPAVSDASPSSRRKRRASDDSAADSSNAAIAQLNGNAADENNHPVDKQPRRKKRKTTNTATNATEHVQGEALSAQDHVQPTEEPSHAPEPAHESESAQEPTEPPPELSDGPSPTPSAEPIPEIDIEHNALPVATDGAAAKATRRLPGRRRQPHANVDIEADLRRQLALKTGYRSLAKHMKVLLSELSSRTVQNLEDDGHYHEQFPEYQDVMRQLDERRDARIAFLDAQRKLHHEQHSRTSKAEKEIETNQFINRVEELKDNFVLQIYWQLKQLERQMKADAGCATDDEDHVVEPTYMDFPPMYGEDRMGAKYASRSRAYVETEKMMDEEEARMRLDQLRKAHVAADPEADDSISAVPGGFAKFTGPDRTEALASFNVGLLVDAADAVENPLPAHSPLVSVPTILNEDAVALGVLANAASIREEQQEAQSQKPAVIPERDVTPSQQIGLPRPASAFEQNSIASTAMSIESTTTTPIKPYKAQDFTEPMAQQPTPAITFQSPHFTSQTKDVDMSQEEVSTATSQPVLNGTTSAPETESTKKETPARSTNRIMDLLNDNHEDPIPRSRDSVRKETSSASTTAAKPDRPSSRTPPTNLPFWHSENFAKGSGQPANLPNDNPLERIRHMLKKTKEKGTLQHSEGATDRRNEPATRAPAPSHYASQPRQNSQEHGPSAWDRQPIKSEYNRSDPTPPTHQSPYPPPGTQQLPPFSQSLPPKPPGPPPVSWRFAHYNAPNPRPDYQPLPTSYAPPPIHPQSFPGPQQQQQQHQQHQQQQSYGGYVPPPGSFQAPPPPQGPSGAYPPIKIQQYGGQPIQPAYGPPPVAYSPPPPPPPQQQYQQQPTSPQSGGGGRRGGYRNGPPPGTQFRSYQGPASRRGG